MGRPRRSASESAELLEEWSGSGQSISQFAAARGVNARTLGWWRWKLGATLPEPEAPAFLEVVVGVLPRTREPVEAVTSDASAE